MSSSDEDSYKLAQEEAVDAKAKASQLIGQAPGPLQGSLRDWETDPICPSGHGVPPDILAIASNRTRIFVSNTPEEKQIAGALARYYTATTNAQKKWALLRPYQKQGLTPPEPLAFM